jgi:hypothetical protein
MVGWVAAVFMNTGAMGSDAAALLVVLEEIGALLARRDNDYTWSSFGDAEAAVAEINGLAAVVRTGRLPAGLAVLFAPTGPIQEVAISSGWGDDFLILADRFDAALDAARRHAAGE